MLTLENPWVSICGKPSSQEQTYHFGMVVFYDPSMVISGMMMDDVLSDIIGLMKLWFITIDI